MVILREKFFEIFILIMLAVVLFMDFHGAYSEDRQYQEVKKVSCIEVIIIGKALAPQPLMSSELVGRQLVYSVDLKLGQREWRHPVDQSAFHTFEIDEKTNYCQSELNPVPWLVKI